jgi:NADH-quinone oxidoreductase subunit M
VSLTLAIDGLNLWPIAASCWLMIPCVLAGSQVDHERPAALYAALLLLQSLLIAAFAALDAVLFVFCLEASALPLWYLLGRWGGPDRQAIARKLLAFQCAGGLAVFAGLMGLSVAAAARGGGEAPIGRISFDIPRVLAEPTVAGWIAVALVLGFWIRAGLFPLHTWFPPAYIAAPASVRVLLTAGAVPLGGFGLARFVLPLATGTGPEPPVSVAGSAQALAIAGAVYFGLLALSQSELNRLVAYVCLCQAALSAAGLCSENPGGAAGGVLHLFNLAVTATVLAVLLDWMEQRFDSGDVRSFGGLARGRPRFATAFTLAALALIAVPGLNGFPGQMLIVWGVLEGPGGDPRLARAAACLVAWLLCAWALVGALLRMLWGPQREPAAFPFEGPAIRRFPFVSATSRPGEAMSASDLTRSELVSLLPLAALILWVGLWPGFFTGRIQPTLEHLLR